MTILVAKESFSTELDGIPQSIVRGVTRVDSKHPLAKQNPEYFEPVDERVHFEVEKATKAPGEKKKPE
jgi:hypothetical protein